MTSGNLPDPAGSRPMTLEAHFLHPALVLRLLSPGAIETLTARMPKGDDALSIRARHTLLERAVAEVLIAGSVPSLAVEEVSGTPPTTGRVVWLEQPLTYRAVQSAMKQVAAGVDARAHFTGTLQSDGNVSVVGDFNPEHVPFSTGRGRLSGRRSMFMLAYIERRQAEEITLRPIVIGERIVHPAVDLPDFWPVDELQVWPSDVDQFKDVDFDAVPGRDLKVMKTVSEDTVKQGFAAIFNEPVVQKDWGGEQLDLWVSSGLTVNGRSLRAAFAFKGPGSGFTPMTPHHLGKNGDQIYRLAGTPADLLVVQHCHGITAAVHGTLRAFAATASPPRRFMLIDGHQTLAILRHFAVL